MTATAAPTVARLLRDDFGNFFGNFVRFDNLRIGELRGLLSCRKTLTGFGFAKVCRHGRLLRKLPVEGRNDQNSREHEWNKFLQDDLLM